MCISDEKNTMASFWRQLTWSLRSLWRGTWPTVDSDGKRIRDSKAGTLLAGGYYCILWCIKGDLEYFSKTLKLEHSSSRTPCIKCRCDRSHTPWTQVNPESSSWLQAKWEQDAWIAAHPRTPEIFTLPGVGIDSIGVDWMHTKHLGSDQYLFGSALMMLVSPTEGKRMMPDSPSVNMANLWAELALETKRLGIKHAYAEIKMSMFAPAAGRFPVLKGKAAEVRSLARPLLKVWEAKMDVSDRQHRLVRLALHSSAELENILDQHSSEYRLSGESSEAFRKLCWSYAACVSALGQYFHLKGIWLFHFTIKTHYLIHCGLDCEELSPRVGWCYSGEDMMSKVKLLVQGSCRGTSAQKLVSKVMFKYMVGMSFNVMTCDSWWR